MLYGIYSTTNKWILGVGLGWVGLEMSLWTGWEFLGRGVGECNGDGRKGGGGGGSHTDCCPAFEGVSLIDVDAALITYFGSEGSIFYHARNLCRPGNVGPPSPPFAATIAVAPSLMSFFSWLRTGIPIVMVSS